jgi:hypothetical protein
MAVRPSDKVNAVIGFMVHRAEYWAATDRGDRNIVA